MSLYNVIQSQTNKYIPFYILPEPTILYLYSSKPIIKSIQKVQLDKQNYINSFTFSDINTYDNNYNYNNCEVIYIRIRRTDTNTKSEWKQFIQKN